MSTSAATTSGFKLPAWPPARTLQIRMTDGAKKSGEVHITAWELPTPLVAAPDVPTDAPQILLHEDYSRWSDHAGVEAMTIGIRVPHLIDEGYCLQYGSAWLPVLFVLQRLVRMRGDSPIFGELRFTGAGIAYNIGGFRLREDRHKFKELRPVFRSLELLAHVGGGAGGSPKGWRKGRVWPRREILEWYREASAYYASSDESFGLHVLAETMEVSENTARRRVRDAKLHWPPTPEELEELEDDE